MREGGLGCTIYGQLLHSMDTVFCGGLNWVAAFRIGGTVHYGISACRGDIDARYLNPNTKQLTLLLRELFKSLMSESFRYL